MTAQETFDRLISEFGATFGLGEVAPDETGRCLIAVGKRVYLSLSAEEPRGTLLVMGQIGAVPAGHRPDVFAQMLRANADGCPMADAHLALIGGQEDGLDPVAVVLVRRPLAGLEPQGLSDLLREFVPIVQAWMDQLTEYLQSGGARPLVPEADADAPSPGGEDDAYVVRA